MPDSVEKVAGSVPARRLPLKINFDSLVMVLQLAGRLPVSWDIFKSLWHDLAAVSCGTAQVIPLRHDAYISQKTIPCISSRQHRRLHLTDAQGAADGGAREAHPGSLAALATGAR